MASVTALIGTIIGTVIVTIFHKPIAEITSRPLPFLQKENIDAVVNTITKKEEEEEPKKVEEVGDYIDSAWSDGETPRRAFEKMEALTINKENARKVTNTCKKLLEYYAMESRRRKQLEKIRDKLVTSFPDLAKEIDMSLFSQCSLWEGKIALYR
jgi:hypothetical protein